MPATTYSVMPLIVIDIDFRSGINGRPDNIILTAEDHEDAIWVPVWDEAEFDLVDKLLGVTVPEDGYKMNIRHRVNDEGYDDYRLIVDKRAAAKAARKRRAMLEQAQAAAAAQVSGEE